tara:strand:+ start:4914 stop:5171 length:258 start_codon:yes stop_codon:yes gene_type:complete
MSQEISNGLYLALESQYQAEINKARATLLVYFSNPVGIGEHPQHLEEMDKLVGKMVDADDKLNMLKKSFPNYADNNYMVCNNNNL